MQRETWTRFFLWSLVFVFGIVLGAKVFDFVVLTSAWGIAPPTSLSLLPYGPRYPVDPGDFFQPLSALLLILLLGGLIAAGKTPWNYRVWLLIPFLSFVVVCAVTPLIFWPMIHVLTDAATKNIQRTEAELRVVIHQWFLWDSVRILLLAVGYLSVIRGISMPYPKPEVVVEEEPFEAEAEEAAVEETRPEELKSQLYERT